VGSLLNWFRTASPLTLVVTASVYGFFVVGLATALVVPEDILASSSGAAAFVSGMAGIVPYIDRVGHLSRYPQVAQFVSSVMWVFAIEVCTVGCYAALREKAQTKERISKNFAGRPFRTLAVVTFAIWMVWFLYTYPVSVTTSSVKLEFGSRLGIGILGTMSVFAWAMSSGALVVLAAYWRDVLGNASDAVR
jgi:hypothetical protein